MEHEICRSKTKAFIEYLLSKVLKRKILITKKYGIYLLYDVIKKTYLNNYSIRYNNQEYILMKWEV